MGVNGPGRTRHIAVAQTFRPEVCSGRGLIAVSKKPYPSGWLLLGGKPYPWRTELQNPSGGTWDL